MSSQVKPQVKSQVKPSNITLEVTGYLEVLSPINRQYHLRQAVDSNLPNAQPIIIESLVNCLFAEMGSKKHLDGCRNVIDGINDSGNDIVLTIVKNLWHDSSGKVTNIPANRASESMDYIRKHTIKRKNLLAYASNPFSSRIDLFTTESIHETPKSRGKSTKILVKI